MVGLWTRSRLNFSRSKSAGYIRYKVRAMVMPTSRMLHFSRWVNPGKSVSIEEPGAAPAFDGNHREIRLEISFFVEHPGEFADGHPRSHWNPVPAREARFALQDWTFNFIRADWIDAIEDKE